MAALAIAAALTCPHCAVEHEFNDGHETPEGILCQECGAKHECSNCGTFNQNESDLHRCWHEDLLLCELCFFGSNDGDKPTCRECLREHDDDARGGV